MTDLDNDRLHLSTSTTECFLAIPAAFARCAAPAVWAAARVVLGRHDDDELPGTFLDVIGAHGTGPFTQAGLTVDVARPDAGPVVLRVGSADPSDEGAARAERVAAQIAVTVARAATDPGAPVAGLDILPAAERETVLHTFNATGYDHGDDRTIPERISAQAAATPDAVALRFGDTDLSYAELERRAGQVAHRLRGLGAGPDDRVAVLAERSLELIIMVVGVLKAGAAYVPLDGDHPAGRLAFLLDDTDARVVLTHSALAARVPRTDRPVVVIDAETETDAQPAGPLDPPAPADLAYVIYTSGSTGNPKGVMVSHEAIRNRLHWMQRQYPIGPGDTVLQKTPYTFDVSVWELFWPLMVGARTVIARPRGHRDNDYLAATIAAERVTTVHFVPTMLRYFLNGRNASAAAGLRRIFCSGEALPADLRDRCHEKLPAVELHNLYGPTEAAVDVTFWPCRPGDSDPVVPIGRPIDNLQCHVLDGHDRPVPIGVTGELHLAGVGLARGYLGRPELTAEKFPQSSVGPGRMYRTGDLARWRPDGALLYLGRNDDQVKLHGQRIELGEIEAALLTHPQVTAAAVVVHRPRDGGLAELTGYVTGPAGPGIEAALLDRLAAMLPAVMVPAEVFVVPEIPQTSSGKTDRKRLPDPSTLRAATPAPTDEPACLIPLNAAGTEPWIWVHPADGEVGRYLEIATLIAAARSSVGLEAAGLDGGEPLTTVPDMAARHVAEIRRTWPEGPVRLAGWAEGAVIAYEMARHLPAVTELVLLDPGVPDAAPALGEPATTTVQAVRDYQPQPYSGLVTRILTAEPRWTPPARLRDHTVPAGTGGPLTGPAAPVVAEIMSR